MGKRVVVVGAGIIGASFALHLARAGADVKLVDALHSTGGVATPCSWAWLNASWGNSEPYFRLRHHAMTLWRDLDKAVPGLSVQWSGGLLWDLPESELRAFAAQQSSWGYGVRLVDAAEIVRLEPQIAKPPVLAAHVKEEGAVEPVHAVEKLLAAAQAAGADLLQGVRVTRLTENGGKITGVMTDDGALEADDVVLAVGTEINTLLEPLGQHLDIDAPAGLLVHSEPVAELLNGLIMSPRLHVRQTAGGALVAGSDFGGTDPGVDAEKAAAELFAELQGFLTGGENLRFSHATIGYRPTPKDGVSAVGRVAGLDGLYICCTHSGITLAPALGALGSQDILTGEIADILKPFNPYRLMRKP